MVIVALIMITIRHLQGFLTLLLALLALPSLYSQIINLPGLVAPEFTIDESIRFESIREEGWGEDGLQYVKITSFDTSGLMDSEIFINGDGTPGTRLLYFYDDQGRLINREFHHPDAPVADIETYVWNESEKLFSVARIYTTGKYGWRFEYRYDDEGRLIFVTKIDRYWKDVVVWEKSFEYNSLGDITGSAGSGLDENIRWYDEFFYNEKNQLTEKIKSDVNNEITAHTRYSYSDSGNISKEWQQSPDGEIWGEIYYYYQENEDGYWTEKQVGQVKSTGISRYFLPVSTYTRTYNYRAD